MYKEKIEFPNPYLIDDEVLGFTIFPQDGKIVCVSNGVVYISLVMNRSAFIDSHVRGASFSSDRTTKICNFMEDILHAMYVRGKVKYNPKTTTHLI